MNPHPGPTGPRLRRVLTAAIAITLAAGASVAASPPATASPPRVANPYAGARVYVNPEWSANAAAEPGGGAVAGQPTAVWLDAIAEIEGADGAMGLREHLDAAVAQDAELIQLTLHNLPGRDCDRLASDGELSVDELDRYRAEYVDPIAAILADPAYARLRVVTLVEPDSLPNLVTHTTPRNLATLQCDQVRAAGVYPLGIGYALARLGGIPNVYAYLDLSHHGQLGWPENATPATELFRQAATSSGSTLGHVHGFVANTASYSVLHELYFDADDVIHGQPVHQTSWVDWNPFIDEVPYVESLRQRLVGLGFSPGISLLVDTSRNGWGGPDRPTGPGPRTAPEEYVNASRLDRRIRVSNWCNQAGAGLGARPAASPEPGIDAYVWVKPPGESDGTGERLAGDAYEPMCDPAFAPPMGSHHPSGALPGAPPAGDWFPAHFHELLHNAWPPL